LVFFFVSGIRFEFTMDMSYNKMSRRGRERQEEGRVSKLEGRLNVNLDFRRLPPVFLTTFGVQTCVPKKASGF
jgi:hypothetical protein